MERPATRENRLYTFVHVSDLHIGDLNANDDAQLDSPVQSWFQFLRTFEGYFGHGREGLLQLVRLFNRLRSSEGALLAVTGDLTAAATNNQYTLARNFLCSEIKLNSGEGVGLRLQEAFDRSIPGNHDHWSGNNPSLVRPLVMLAGTSPQLKQTFPDLPIAIRRLDLGHGRTLVIAGIDTDADVNHWYERLWARGSFCSQLDGLGKTLSQTDPLNEIRVLLLHHSPSYPKFPLGIGKQSQLKLKTFLNEHQIAVLLSGHVHVPGRHVQSVSQGNFAWNILEARCGTTTQRDTLPNDWPAWKLPPNTLLVHRLYDVDDSSGKRIEWRVSLLQRTVRGFIDSRKIPITQSYFDAIWDRPVTVWPRKRKTAPPS